MENKTNPPHTKPSECNLCTEEILETIALQEAALAHILNAEGEKIQCAVANNAPTDELLKLNETVAKVIANVTHLEIVLTDKLHIALKCPNCQPCSPRPEPCKGTLKVKVVDCKCKEPLCGVCVEVCSDSKVVASGVTDEKGCFSACLDCGCYKVVLKYKEHCITEEIELSRKDPEVCIEKCFHDRPEPCKGTLKVKVVDCKCKEPLCGVCVEVCSDSKVVASGVTDEKGCFSACLDCGCYKVVLKYKEHCITEEFELSRKDPEVCIEKCFHDRPEPCKGILAIKVVECKCKEPLCGVCVEVCSDSKVVASGLTDEKGCFSACLDCGCYKVVLKYKEHCITEEFELSCKDPEVCIEKCFHDRPEPRPCTATVCGIVRDKCGAPIHDAVITDGCRQLAKTNRCGVYVFKINPQKLLCLTACHCNRCSQKCCIHDLKPTTYKVNFVIK